jgi:phospholipid transport system substrate-binding protein
MKGAWHGGVLAMAVSVLVGFLASTPAAWGGPPTDQLRASINRVLKTLEDPELKKESRARERRKMVRKVAEDIFDFSETAKRSLAIHWHGRTPAERDEFVQLFADLLERSYISKVELFNGEKIAFGGEIIDGDQSLVRSKIITKQGTEVPVDYRMHKRGERWLVYDVVIEGVSLISNYRTQFNKIIQTSSYQELVKKMKSKQEQAQEEEKRTSQKL